jgi:hypothetical protein
MTLYCFSKAHGAKSWVILGGYATSSIIHDHCSAKLNHKDYSGAAS